MQDLPGVCKTRPLKPQPRPPASPASPAHPGPSGASAGTALSALAPLQSGRAGGGVCLFRPVPHPGKSLQDMAWSPWGWGPVSRLQLPRAGGSLGPRAAPRTVLFHPVVRHPAADIQTESLSIAPRTPPFRPLLETLQPAEIQP